jgi:class 3 adenylate cyclase
MAELEADLQAVLANGDFSSVYLKPAGDGMMVICEDGWVKNGAEETSLAPDDSDLAGLSKASAVKFIQTCLAFMERAVQTLQPYGRRIGCGIDAGRVVQVFACGRRDYLGDAINQASKLESKLQHRVRISERLFLFASRDPSAQTILAGAAKDEKGYGIAVGHSG